MTSDQCLISPKATPAPGSLLGTYLMNSYGQKKGKKLNNRSTFSISKIGLLGKNDSQKVQEMRLSHVETLSHDEQTTVQNSGGLVLSGLRQTWRQDQVKYGQRVILKDVSEINRHKKQQNSEALKFFMSEKQALIKVSLLKSIERRFAHEFGCVLPVFRHDVPIPIINQYNKELVVYRNRCLLDFAERQFLSYIASIRKMHRYIYATDGILCTLLPLKTRYSESYQRKVHDRMCWLAHHYRNAGCVYVVLTVDPANYDNDKIRMWTEIVPDVAKFIDKTRRRFIRHGKKMPPYLVTIEAQKEPRSCGNPHINIVFFGCHRLMDWRKVMQYWGKGNIRINKTKDGQTVRNPVMYVTKYITKTFTETDADNCLTQSLVWLFNKRSFNSSRNLVTPLYPKGKGDWFAEYFCCCSSQRFPIDDMVLIMNRLNSFFGGHAGFIPPPNLEEVIPI